MRAIIRKLINDDGVLASVQCGLWLAVWGLWLLLPEEWRRFGTPRSFSELALYLRPLTPTAWGLGMVAVGVIRMFYATRAHGTGPTRLWAQYMALMAWSSLAILSWASNPLGLSSLLATWFCFVSGALTITCSYQLQVTKLQPKVSLSGGVFSAAGRSLP